MLEEKKGKKETRERKKISPKSSYLVPRSRIISQQHWKACRFFEKTRSEYGRVREGVGCVESVDESIGGELRGEG